MLFFKWMGGFLLVFCGFLLGWMNVCYRRRQRRQAEGFLTILYRLRLQIDCFSTPIATVLEGLEDTLLSDCAVGARQADFSALLANAELCLSPDACRLLYEFGERLGGGRREEQLRCCDYYIARLTPYCDELRKDLARREKTAFLLPILGSLAGVLLFL